MNKYEFEKSKILDLIPDNLIDKLDGMKESFFIAGGAVTSVFSNKDVNDIDIYPKTIEAKYKLLKYCSDNTFIASCTDKSVFAVESGEYDLNIICLDIYPTANDIFKTFDFSIVKGAYDMDSEEFSFHDDFFLDLSKRNLRCDVNTSFPLMSIFRANKYVDRGYEISKSELARMLLKVTTLNIDSVEEAEKHLGGLYGIDIATIFKEKEFTLDALMEVLANGKLQLHSEPNKMKINKRFDVLLNRVEEEYCNAIDTRGLRQYKGTVFKEVSPYVWEALDNDFPRKLKIRNMDNLDKESMYIYKDVNFKDNKFTSFHNPSFEYTTEEDIISDSHGKLYFYSSDVSGGQYKKNEDSFRIKCLASFNDIVRFWSDSLEVSKCKFIKVIRENNPKKE